MTSPEVTHSQIPNQRAKIIKDHPNQNMRFEPRFASPTNSKTGRPISKSQYEFHKTRHQKKRRPWHPTRTQHKTPRNDSPQSARVPTRAGTKQRKWQRSKQNTPCLGHPRRSNMDFPNPTSTPMKAQSNRYRRRAADRALNWFSFNAMKMKVKSMHALHEK